VRDCGAAGALAASRNWVHNQWAAAGVTGGVSEATGVGTARKNPDYGPSPLRWALVQAVNGNEG
jgi:hypothetical protein